MSTNTDTNTNINMNYHRIINESRNVMVDFYADWCKSCIEFEPTYDTYKDIYTNCTFLKINVDDYDDIAADKKVEKVPTFILFSFGKEITRINGGKKEDIEKALNSIKPQEKIEIIDDF